MHRKPGLSRLIVALCAVLIALFAAFITPAPAYASCPAFPYTVPAADTAALINAITCANGTAANDVINLTNNSAYALTSAFSGSDGLPPITAGSGTLTINGSGATILRSAVGGTPSFRLFSVNSGANLTLNRVRLTNGSLAAGGGGAIFNNGTLKLTSVSVESNTATWGAGIFNNLGTVILHESLIANNVAATYGGGVANGDGTLHVINSTISGNAANGTGASSGGGAIDSYGTAPVMSFYNSTIAYNTAVAPNTQKSGIWMESGNAGYFNTIIAHNNGANNCFFPFPAVWSFNSKNIDNGTSCGFTNGTYNNTDPLLAALANNGGSTRTHALLPGSPAINNGDNGYAVQEDDSTPLTTDQRGAGYPRISGGTVDIGAFEVQQCPTFPHTVPAGDSINLILAITCANGTAANDLINLTNSTYTLTAESAFEVGLPPIAAAATGGTLTINGNGATIQRSSAPGTPNFKMFEVLSGANLRLDRITLANGYAQVGGAIFSDGTLTITNSTIRNSYALAGGAVSTTGGATTVVLNSLIANNQAERYGGGFDMSAGTLWIVNSTVTGNAIVGSDPGYGGGAIDAYNSPTITIINSTIANNSAAVQAARSGIWLENGTLTIQNSIVANNNGANNCEVSGGVVIDNGYNIDNGTSCNFAGLIGRNTDPMLNPLTNNGGFTQTMSLMAGSPAQNMGNNNLAYDHTLAALTTDQRGSGFPRIIGSSVDVGAFESNLAPQVPGVPTLLSPTGTTNSTPIQLQWIHDRSALFYDITVTNTDGDQDYTFNDEQAQTWCNAVLGTCSFPLNSVVEGGLFTWSVRASNQAGDGAPSATMEFTLATAPIPPTLIAPIGTQSGSPSQFTWERGNGTYWYYVWLSGAGGTVYDYWYNAYDICTASTCSVPILGNIQLPPGPYTWWVQAWNPYGGYGAWSDGTNFTVPGSTQPTQTYPQGLIYDDPVPFVWGRMLGAEWYQIWVINANGTLFNQWMLAEDFCNETQCGFYQAGIPKGWHQWWVQAWGPIMGYSPWSSGMIFSLPTTMPTQISPQGAITSLTPLLSWNQVPEASWYYIWVQRDDGAVVATWHNSSTVCLGGGVCGLQSLPLVVNRSYTWWVQAWSDYGSYSDWSPGMPFNVVSPAPPEVITPEAPVIEATPEVITPEAPVIEATPTDEIAPETPDESANGA